MRGTKRLENATFPTNAQNAPRNECPQEKKRASNFSSEKSQEMNGPPNKNECSQEKNKTRGPRKRTNAHRNKRTLTEKNESPQEITKKAIITRNTADNKYATIHTHGAVRKNTGSG